MNLMSKRKRRYWCHEQSKLKILLQLQDALNVIYAMLRLGRYDFTVIIYYHAVGETGRHL